MSYQLSIVVAFQQAEENLEAIITGLRPAHFSQVQYIFCYLSSDNNFEKLLPTGDNIIRHKSETNALIPHMWRDGIRICQSDRIAFTTAHCIPANDWVESALGLDMEQYVAVGGSIEQASNSKLSDWAIYIQRYVNFSSERKMQLVSDIAADNSVYRTQDILEQDDLLNLGFWEPSFHHRFIAANKALLFDPTLKVIHKNRYNKSSFFKQRFFHGTAFGRERSTHYSRIRRLIMVALSPVIPFIFLIKLYHSTRNNPLLETKFRKSIFYIFYFLTGWALGEMKGYIQGATK